MRRNLQTLENKCESAFPLSIPTSEANAEMLGRVRAEVLHEAARMRRLRRAGLTARWSLGAAAAVALSLMLPYAPQFSHDRTNAYFTEVTDAEALRDFVGAANNSATVMEGLLTDDWTAMESGNGDGELDAIHDAFLRLGNVGA